MRLVSVTPCVVQSKRSTRIGRARSANSLTWSAGVEAVRLTRTRREEFQPFPSSTAKGLWQVGSP